MSQSPPATAEVVNILSHIEEEEAPKTLLQLVSQPPRKFHLTTLLVILWCTLFLAISPMLATHLPDPIAALDHRYQLIAYSFQIPAVVLVAATLGPWYGLVTVLLYLAAGLLGAPVFAGGGGYRYINAVTFGYLIGYLFVPNGIHRMLTRAYRDRGWFRGRSLWMLLAAMMAVVIVHVWGAIGIGIHLVIDPLTLDQAQQWWLQLSWPSMVYDLLFSLVAIAAVRISRLLLWFCLY